ncbi:hypothetical protein ABZS66_60220 [Dactylosporangium sp. NPDC005572]|uniref:hypothetical protein n=1 Tax=Dactylosporangium sp. NPDC005572 TaxID=3156889 RepID=UPI0033B8AE59
MVLIAGLVTAVALHGRPTDNDVTLPGSDAQAARDLLERADPGARQANAQLVVHVEHGRLDDPANTAAIGRAADAIGRGLLVPATMALLGPANWWRPGRVARPAEVPVG